MKKMQTFLQAALLAGAVLAPLSVAHALKAYPGPAPQPAPPPPPSPSERAEDEAAELTAGLPKDQVLLLLKDGSRIAGRPAGGECVVATAFGELRVPASEMRSIRVGTASDPGLKERIAASIKKLGDPAFDRREEAMEGLRKIGLPAMGPLRAARVGPDQEVKIRAQRLVEEMEKNLDGSEAPREEDELRTGSFTVVGIWRVGSLRLETKHGVLEVEKGRLDRVVWPPATAKEASVKVDPRFHAGFGHFRKTGVYVRKGDPIRVRASGKIRYGGPYAVHLEFGPDGAANLGVFEKDIPEGCLVGRIGKDGPAFKLGSEIEVTAPETGLLQLALAFRKNDRYVPLMTGEITVRLRVAERGGAREEK